MFGLSKKSLCCLILGLSLIICATSYGQTPTPSVPGDKPQSQTAKEAKKSASNQRGTEEAPLVIKVLPSPNTNEKSANIPQEREHKAASDWWGIPTDGWLAIFTCGLFVATVALWSATRRLVKGADNTAKRELRAYVGCHRIAILDDPVRGEFVVKNFGQTIAKELEIRLGGAIQTVKPVQFTTSVLKCKTVLMPGEAIRADHAIELEPHDLDLVTNDAGTIFTWGRIDYRMYLVSRIGQYFA